MASNRHATQRRFLYAASLRTVETGWPHLARQHPRGELTLESLNQTLLTRISRALEFRDAVFALFATMDGREPEEMLCELDSLLFHWPVRRGC